MPVSNLPKQGMAKLHTLLAEKNWNLPLKRGEISSPIVTLDFADVKEASDHFKPFARELAYDCGEMAIATFLQAKAYNKPLVLLPFIVTGKFHHESINYNPEKVGTFAPADLAGKTVGVRTYSQTSGVWARGILQHEYGVDLDKVNWLVFDEAHLAEHNDPPNVKRAPKGKKLGEMLLNGEIDAAIGGPKDPRIKTLIPDAATAALAWSKRNDNVTPINHMFVVQKAVCDARPDVVREVYRMLKEGRSTVPAAVPGTPNFTKSGYSATRKALEMGIQFAYEQKVIPRKFTVDEMYDDVTRVLE